MGPSHFKSFPSGPDYCPYCPGSLVDRPARAGACLSRNLPQGTTSAHAAPTLGYGTCFDLQKGPAATQDPLVLLVFSLSQRLIDPQQGRAFHLGVLVISLYIFLYAFDLGGDTNFPPGRPPLPCYWFGARGTRLLFILSFLLLSVPSASTLVGNSLPSTGFPSTVGMGL